MSRNGLSQNLEALDRRDKAAGGSCACSRTTRRSSTILRAHRMSRNGLSQNLEALDRRDKAAGGSCACSRPARRSSAVLRAHRALAMGGSCACSHLARPVPLALAVPGSCACSRCSCRLATTRPRWLRRCPGAAPAPGALATGSRWRAGAAPAPAATTGHRLLYRVLLDVILDEVLLGETFLVQRHLGVQRRHVQRHLGKRRRHFQRHLGARRRRHRHLGLRRRHLRQRSQRHQVARCRLALAQDLGDTRLHPG